MKTLRTIEKTWTWGGTGVNKLGTRGVGEASFHLGT